MLSENVPPIENAEELWTAADREQAYWATHYHDLLNKYPEQFVSVNPASGEVVATSPDLFELLEILHGQHREPTRLWTRFVTAHAERLLL